jgi:hypothetical protein
MDFPTVLPPQTLPIWLIGSGKTDAIFQLQHEKFKALKPSD